MTDDKGKVWTRTLDASAYKGEDDVKAGAAAGRDDEDISPCARRAAPGGQHGELLHPLDAVAVRRRVFRQARRDRNRQVVARQGAAYGFPSVSFSSLDLVGHAFGPRSHEVQDILVRLDATIGRLLDHLDQQVGADNYVLGLSADHGVADIPELAGKGGRLSAKEVKDTLEKVFVPVLGVGDHIVSNAYTDIYLTPKTVERLRVDGALRKAAIDALVALPAVDQVFVGAELAKAEARESDGSGATRGGVELLPGQEWRPDSRSEGELADVERRNHTRDGSSVRSARAGNPLRSVRAPGSLHAGCIAGRYRAFAGIGGADPDCTDRRPRAHRSARAGAEGLPVTRAARPRGRKTSGAKPNSGPAFAARVLSVYGGFPQAGSRPTETSQRRPAARSPTGRWATSCATAGRTMFRAIA